MKYFFTLGNHPELSVSEIKAKLTQLEIAFTTLIRDNSFFIIETETEIELVDLIDKLGGTIKAGEILFETKSINQSELLKQIKVQEDKKNIFGISAYNCSLDFKKIGLGIKKELKNKDLSVRYVDSKENPLSSVIVQKEILKKNGTELCIMKTGENFFVGRTVAVQNFQKYSHFDYDRPEVDNKKGMLPPKLATIMINLAEKNSDAVLYDPFCGNGTVLQQAVLLGHKKVIGSDNDEEQIDKTKKNLDWLKGQKIEFEEKLFHADSSIDSTLEPSSVDLIVTEPYMGPPLRGNESYEKINETVTKLKRLYQDSFRQFSKILKKDGSLIFIIPSFIISERQFDINMTSILPKTFSAINQWQYARENQRVVRNIYRIKKS
jgi:tRNA G10  N-methylase Trm11